ncbi:MAG: LysM peptidoglycan-binding domain-containing protein [bacterium]
MKTYLKSAFVFLLFASLGFNYGCAGNKRIEGAEAPVAAEPVATPVAATPSTSYSVEKGDCLWNIAGKSDIYSDSFAWPLLLKANRDEIQDPDLIYPNQVLKVQKDISASEMTTVHQLSDKTPKYKEHSKPRASLPVNYF